MSDPSARLGRREPRDGAPWISPSATMLDHLLRDVRRDDALRPGDVLGTFTILCAMTRGGMGETYLASQAPFGRWVIVKVIRGTGGDEIEQRFRTERRLLSGLHHTYIVPIYAAGRKGGREYFVMPYIRGATVREIAHALRERPVGPGFSIEVLLVELAEAKDDRSLQPWRTQAKSVTASSAPVSRMPARPPAAYYRWVAQRLIEAAEGLAAAHAKGVVHADVKPSNVMIEASTGKTKVIDLGLAVTGSGTEVSQGASIPCPKLPGRGFAAPEVHAGTCSQRSDVYGLGACLQELIALDPPGTPRSTAPFDLASIARKAMTAAPEDRYPTAVAFADDLRCWLEQRPTVARGGRRTFYALGLLIRRNVAATVAILAVFSLLFGSAVAARVLAHQATVLADQATILADQRKRELERLQFDQLLARWRDAQFGSRLTGWSEDAIAALKEVVRMRPDEDQRNRAAWSFSGVDARQVLRHELPSRTPENGVPGLSSVAFGPHRTRFVAGGLLVADSNKVDLSPALYWDGNLARKPVASTQPGAGPVAFPDAQSPLQLLLPDGKRWSLLLWNVATNSKVAEIRIPVERGTELTAALSADGRFAALSLCDVMPPGGPPQRPITTLWAIDRKNADAAVTKIAEWKQLATAMAFSADGQYFATGSLVGEGVVHSTRDGAEIQRIQDERLPVTALAFGTNPVRSDDARLPPGTSSGWRLAVATQGGNLAVWDLAARHRMNSFHGSEHNVHAIAFSRDGATMVSAGRVVPYLWDVATGRQLLQLRNGKDPNLRSYMTGVAISPDDRRIAISSAGMFSWAGLDVFELDDDRGIRTYRGLSGMIEKVWLSPSRKWVAALAQNWQLGVWERATGRLAFVWNVPVGWTADNAALLFLEATNELIFSSGSRATRWHLLSGERTDRWEIPLGLNDALALRPDGSPLLVRRDVDGSFEWGKPRPPLIFRAWQLLPNGAKREVYRITDIPPTTVGETSLSGDGRILAVNRQSPTLQPLLYDGLTGERMRYDPTTLASAQSMVVTASGTALAVSVGDRAGPRGQVFRLPELRSIGEHPRPLRFCDDVGKLAVSIELADATERGVALHRIGEDRPIVTFDAGQRPPGTPGMPISADGHLVIWGRTDGTVCVADVNRCLERLTPFGTR